MKYPIPLFKPIRHPVWFCRAAVCLLIVLSLMLPSLCLAKPQTFVREYTYEATELDSKESCRVIALEQIKRILLEELGTYIESSAEVRDYNLTRESITVLSAGIVRTTVIDEKWVRTYFWVKARIVADPKDVAKSVNAMRQDQQKTKDLEESHRKADEALKEIEKLKKELETAKADQGKKSRYDDLIRELSAIDAFERSVVMMMGGNYRGAIDALGRAISIKPDYLIAINNRGIAYAVQDDHGRAIQDFDKVIQLKPGDATAYNNRAVSYGKMGHFKKALNDYQKGLSLNPKDEAIMYNLACTYALMKNDQKACEWLKKAVANGFHDLKTIREDKDLIYIREKPCYREILSQGGGTSRP